VADLVEDVRLRLLPARGGSVFGLVRVNCSRMLISKHIPQETPFHLRNSGDELRLAVTYLGRFVNRALSTILPSMSARRDVVEGC
jgi:hypothetical protein